MVPTQQINKKTYIVKKFISSLYNFLSVNNVKICSFITFEEFYAYLQSKRFENNFRTIIKPNEAITILRVLYEFERDEYYSF